MTTLHNSDTAAWQVVDEGWGRRAVDFATLSEPGNCREYLAVAHRLGVSENDRLLDIACGSGLAIELARIRGAECAGIDASHRLVAVARDRNPGSDVRVGDMLSLPWPDASFDVVTSFRGIWGTTPAALDEVHHEDEVIAAAKTRACALACEDESQLRDLLHPSFGWISHKGEWFDPDSYLDSNHRGSNTWDSQELQDIQVHLVGDTAVLRAS